MPKISRLTRKEVTPETGAIYDRYMQQRGNVPNMFRTVAHRAMTSSFSLRGSVPVFRIASKCAIIV